MSRMREPTGYWMLGVSFRRDEFATTLILSLGKWRWMWHRSRELEELLRSFERRDGGA